MLGNGLERCRKVSRGTQSDLGYPLGTVGWGSGETDVGTSDFLRAPDEMPRSSVWKSGDESRGRHGAVRHHVTHLCGGVRLGSEGGVGLVKSPAEGDFGFGKAAQVADRLAKVVGVVDCFTGKTVSSRVDGLFNKGRPRGRGEHWRHDANVNRRRRLVEVSMVDEVSQW